MEKNKVRFGLKNAYYAKATFDENGGVSYATPKRLPGAVALSVSAQGDNENFYADDIVYYIMSNNSGYDGTVELALIPEEFLTEILHEEKNEDGILLENADSETERFALLFEFTGDKHAIRHVLYCCSASRPNVEGQTKEQNKQVKTETLNLSATPLPNGYVKAKTSSTTTKSVYDGWYNEVYQPTPVETPAALLDRLTIGSLTLSPVFDADTTEYTTTTTNTTNTITATGEEGTTVAIKVNGTNHTSGESATWEDGENTVVITVTKTGATTTVYTVTVTKSTGGGG